METWEAILLGVIQGLTEFLPVSSSGHLELGQYFLGFQDLKRYILFDLICHLGTLIAIMWFFFPQIKQSLIGDTRRLRQVILGTLPLFPLVLILKPIKALFDQPQYLGYCFLLTALFLYVGSQFSFKPAPAGSFRRRWGDSLTVGLFQAIAILPGVSRSGSTISAARVLGWSKEEAISFSFLLAIPAILGGMALEILTLFSSHEVSAPISNTAFFMGFLTSFVVGWLSLKLLVLLTKQNQWRYFIWYCLALGIFTTLYFNTPYG